MLEDENISLCKMKNWSWNNQGILKIKYFSHPDFWNIFKNFWISMQRFIRTSLISNHLAKSEVFGVFIEPTQVTYGEQLKTGYMRKGKIEEKRKDIRFPFFQWARMYQLCSEADQCTFDQDSKVFIQPVSYLKPFCSSPIYLDHTSDFRI